MTHSTKTVLLTVLLVAGTVAVVSDLQAGCHRGRGRSYYHHYSRPTYHRPVCAPPRYPQPQPIFQPQPGTQPIFPPQRQPQPQFTAPGQQPVGPATQQPIGQTQAPPRTAPQGTPSAQQPAAPNTAAANNAQMTALQALAGWGANASEPAASQAPAAQRQQPSHVGTWTASLPNGARVQLTLQASGAFRWIATNKSGTNSTFEGSYTVSNGSLTLVRSNDNQKLAGNMTSSSNTAFNFKLNGAKDAGLNFVRG